MKELENAFANTPEWKLVREYICNQVGIKGIQKLKGALGRIALIGSYRIWLARNSQEWSAGELVTVKD